MANETTLTNKVFLVILKLQEKDCACKALEEVDRQLYKHVKGKNKSYAYDTIQFHDKCYMVIEVWANDGKHGEWLEKALEGHGKPLDITDSA